MRDIKFKAFVKHLNWLVDVEIIDFSLREVEVDLSNGLGDTSNYSFDEVDLFLNTGVKDNKGQEIFEGHVVLVTHMLTELTPPYKAVVRWNNGKFILDTLNNNKINNDALNSFNIMDSFGSSYEILGHSKTNPELLVNN